MKILRLLILISICSCGPAGQPDISKLASGGIPIGQFRGYESISEVVKQRLLDPLDPSTDVFELGIFLGTRDAQSLPALLGAFSGDGPENTYRNGIPNAMNTAVWYLVAQRLSKQMSSYCTDPAPVFGADYKLSPEVVLLVQKVCQWPATSDDDLGLYWDRVMGAFAPPSEREAWLALLGELRPLEAIGGETVLKLGSETLLLNPYFHLKN